MWVAPDRYPKHKLYQPLVNGETERQEFVLRAYLRYSTDQLYKLSSARGRWYRLGDFSIPVTVRSLSNQLDGLMVNCSNKRGAPYLQDFLWRARQDSNLRPSDS
jgi:hypothetical protein